MSMAMKLKRDLKINKTNWRLPLYIVNVSIAVKKFGTHVSRGPCLNNWISIHFIRKSHWQTKISKYYTLSVVTYQNIGRLMKILFRLFSTKHTLMSRWASGNLWHPKESWVEWMKSTATHIEWQIEIHVSMSTTSCWQVKRSYVIHTMYVPSWMVHQWWSIIYSIYILTSSLFEKLLKIPVFVEWKNKPHFLFSGLTFNFRGKKFDYEFGLV